MKKYSIAAILVVLTMILALTLCFHLLPSPNAGWITWTASIAFANLALVLLVVAAIFMARRNLRGIQVQS